MNVIDLFAGCGGLSKGFMDAGYNILIGVDTEQAALNTFARNHDGAIAMKADLSDEKSFDEIKKAVGDHEVDIIIAGPPCQGFSLTGPRNFDDARNSLYLAVIEIVKRYKPKGFIIENVPGMATLYGGQIKEEVLNRFRKLGYNIDCKVLCAADYGVPQLRRRLIFMGIRQDIGVPKFPKPIFSETDYRTCRDAISDWVPVSIAEDKADPGHKVLCTQYDGHVIEETGLIKMDFLGLKTLSILKEAIENIRIV